MEELGVVNSRLKTGKVGVSVYLRTAKSKLYLQATLPPKPGSSKTEWSQQKIALHVYANPAGFKRAEAEAWNLGRQLALGQFDWKNYQPEESEQTDKKLKVGSWAERFEADYWSRRKRTNQTETTWRTEYAAVLGRLDQNAVLTSAYVVKEVTKTEPDSRMRLRYCMVLTAFAQFAGITVDLKTLRGNYGPMRVSPRDLPEDDAIEAAWEQVSPQWQWVYGAMATWGLRPHECFQVEQIDGYILSVGSGTKTGERRVWACYPEWVDKWSLKKKVLPPVDLARGNARLGQAVGQVFRRAKIAFPPYALRHCWAIRTMEVGLDLSLAAQQMGHSVQVHTDLYHHWISDRHHQRAFDLLMNRPGRLLPPSQRYTSDSSL